MCKYTIVFLYFCPLRNPLSKDVCDVAMRGCRGKRRHARTCTLTHAHTHTKPLKEVIFLKENSPKLLMKAIQYNTITGLMKEDIVSKESRKDEQEKITRKDRKKSRIIKRKRELASPCTNVCLTVCVGP